MINIWTSVCEIILLLYWCLLFFFLGQWNLVIQPVPSVLWSCCSLIQSFSIVVVSQLQAFAVPLRLQWFPVLFCPIFGHIFFSSSAQNLPFSMTVRIKCPSAFGDRHRSKIESGYHSRNTDLSSRSNNFYIRQKPGYPPWCLSDKNQDKPLYAFVSLTAWFLPSS